MDASNSQEIQGETGATHALGLSEPKFCEDCRFCQVGPSGPRYAKCGSQFAKPLSDDRYVAREFNVPPYASVMRSVESRTTCGPEAKWFEPRPATAEAAA